jgi:hypothetical protein
VTNQRSTNSRKLSRIGTFGANRFRGLLSSRTSGPLSLRIRSGFPHSFCDTILAYILVVCWHTRLQQQGQKRSLSYCYRYRTTTWGRNGYQILKSGQSWVVNRGCMRNFFWSNLYSMIHAHEVFDVRTTQVRRLAPNGVRNTLVPKAKIRIEGIMARESADHHSIGCASSLNGLLEVDLSRREGVITLIGVLAVSKNVCPHTKALSRNILASTVARSSSMAKGYLEAGPHLQPSIGCAVTWVATSECNVNPKRTGVSVIDSPSVDGIEACVHGCIVVSPERKFYRHNST